MDADELARLAKAMGDEAAFVFAAQGGGPLPRTVPRISQPAAMGGMHGEHRQCHRQWIARDGRGMESEAIGGPAGRDALTRAN